MSGLIESTEIVFPEDVEEEVNSCFENLFSGRLSAIALLENLSHRRISKDSRDQSFFACLIHNLFDEYRFFAKYPENELLLTAAIFGGIINKKLISNVPLSVALRCVLESLRKPPGQKLFKFGIHALSQFQERLSEVPEFCNFLLTIDHLHELYPELIAFIRHSILSTSPSDVHASVPLQESPERIAFTPKGTPSDISASLKDRLVFILNNTSEHNVESQTSELRSCLKRPEEFSWLAFHIVTTRAVIEAAFHEFYFNLIDSVAEPLLYACIKKETYRFIHSAIAYKKEFTTVERSSLRNLGSWLGSLTIKRNKPILYKDLDLKSVVADAFYANRLVDILPFICKVLDQAQFSVVFRPFNPWLMRTMSLLSEIYHHTELKLNLKFEIEVLCKNINIDIKLIEPSTSLRRRFEAKDEYKPGPQTSIQDYLLRTLTFTAISSEGANLSVLKQLFSIAFEFSVRDLAVNVTDRSISVSFTTYSSILTNDFGDDSEHAVDLFSPVFLSLVKSLAYMSSRETFKHLFYRDVITLFQYVDANLISTISDLQISMFINDNIDVASSLIVFYSETSAKQKIAEESRRYMDIEPPVSYEDFQTLIFPQPSSEVTDFFTLPDSGALNQQSVLDAFTDRYTASNDNGDTFLINSALQEFLDAPSNITLHKLLNKFSFFPSIQQENREAIYFDCLAKLITKLFCSDSLEHCYLFATVTDKLCDVNPSFRKGILSSIFNSPFRSKFNLLALCSLFLSFSKLDLPKCFDNNLRLGITSKSNLEKVLLLTFSRFDIMKPLLEQRSGDLYATLLPCTIFLHDFAKLPSTSDRRTILRVLLNRCLECCNSQRELELFDWQAFISLLNFFCPLGSTQELQLLFQVSLECAIESHLQEGSEYLLPTAAMLYNCIFLRIHKTQLTQGDMLLFEVYVTHLKIIGAFILKSLESGLLSAAHFLFDLIAATLALLTNADFELNQSLNLANLYRYTSFYTFYLLVTFCLHSLPQSRRFWVLPSSLPLLVARELFVSSSCKQSLAEILRLSLSILDNSENASLAFTVTFYRSLAKLLLVLSHDIPEFLVSYHSYIILNLHHGFVQLRNLVTSAVPRGVTLPNPLSPDLKVDLLPEMVMDPLTAKLYFSDFPIPAKVSGMLLNALQSPIDVDFSSSSELLSPQFFNRIHVLIARSCLEGVQSGAFVSNEIISLKVVPIYLKLLALLTRPRRHDFLLTLTDNLRYPNRYTHFFSCVLLSLFVETGDVSIKENVTRILLGRLIAHRPHPWGVMITFIELVKNPRYKFWTFEYTRSTPEIEKMFITVAKSCMTR